MRVRNGDIDLHVAEDGDPAAPPILLLHGITSSVHTWDWLVPDLVDRFRVLRLDFRGHGLSDRAPGAYLPAHYRSDAVAALEQVAGRPCVVVGHSLGGVTAAALAQDHADLLTGAVMEDPPLGPVGVSDRQSLEGSALLDGFRFMREGIPGIQESGMDAARLASVLAGAPSTTRESTFGEVLVADALDAMAASMLHVDATVLDPVLDGSIGMFVDPGRPFAVPSLIVAGDPSKPDTVARPRSTDHYARLSPDLTVTTVDGAGHLVHDEKASRPVFLDALLTFLARVAPDRTA